MLKKQLKKKKRKRKRVEGLLSDACTVMLPSSDACTIMYGGVPIYLLGEMLGRRVILLICIRVNQTVLKSCIHFLQLTSLQHILLHALLGNCSESSVLSAQ